MKRFNKYKYLGIRYESKGMEGAKNEKICKANQWWGRLGSIAKLRANRYEIVRGMWKNIAVPGIMYGMNVLRWKYTSSASRKNRALRTNRVYRRLNQPPFSNLLGLCFCVRFKEILQLFIVVDD